MFVIKHHKHLFEKYGVFYKDDFCEFPIEYFFTMGGAKKYIKMLSKYGFAENFERKKNMGEMSYITNHENEVEFCDDDTGRYGCLCTFPFNYSNKVLGIGTIASLALLGAAIAIDANEGGFDKECYHDNCSRSGRTRYILPDCVPRWIRDEIRRNLNMMSEEIDTKNFHRSCYGISEEEKDNLNNTNKPLSVELVTQLIFDSAVECKDEEVEERLWKLLSLIDTRGIEN